MCLSRRGPTRSTSPFFLQKIEEFFSREVNIVISDAPEWKLRNPGGAPEIVSPGTPRSLAAAFGAATNSPWSPATPTEDKKTAKSRVETILERAKIQAKGTTDVIENAHKWGLKIWSLAKCLDWLEKFKIRIGFKKRSSTGSVGTANRHLTRSQSQDSGLCQTKDLCAPYLKFESVDFQFRPVVHEFRRYPALNFDGRAGTSPFYSSIVSSDASSRPPKGRAEAIKEQQHQQARSATRRLLSGGNKQKGKDTSGKKAANSKAPKTPTRKGRGRNNATNVEQKGAAPKEKEGQEEDIVLEPQPGYCELCETHYEDLEEHLETGGHQKVVNFESVWSQVDATILNVNQYSTAAAEDQ